MLKRIRVTEAIRHRLKIVRFAEQFISCDDQGISYGEWEVLKLEFANEVIAEIERDADRLGRLAIVPSAKPAAVVEIRMTPKRNRA